MNVTARAVRSGKWWAIEVPEVEGGFTQAKRIDQIEPMVKDLVAFASNVPEESVQVTLDLCLDPQENELLGQARAKVEHAKQAQQEASAISRAAVNAFRKDGLTLKEIGYLLGLSYQRVAQLTK